MCIIVYKPQDIQFPNKKTLKTCFNNNPDGAGFMFADNGKVTISKGFMTFKSFWKALNFERSKHGNDIPYVMHFRIGTQGGNIPENTHPFALTNKENVLKALDVDCGIGIAHNGIISMCNRTNTDISDTMIFIKDYLSWIITDLDYYKDSRKLDVIEELAGSKLAILDSKGHCELIGKFTEHNNCYYSNSTYEEARYTYSYGGYSGNYNGYSNYSAPYSYSAISHKGKNFDKYGYCENYYADAEYCLSCSWCNLCYDKDEQDYLREETESYYNDMKVSV